MKFLTLLQKIATKSDHEQFKHATLVFRGGTLIAQGWNYGPSHSEVHAIEKAWGNRRKNLSILNIRIRRDGSFGNARPCETCWAYCKENRVHTVTYSTGKGLEFKSERIK